MEHRKPSLSEYAARKIRGRLGEERISVAELARRLGWTQSYLQRRVDGRVAFRLDELEAVARELRMQIAELLPLSADTLTKPSLTESTSSETVSSSRPPRDARRHNTRPARTTHKPSTTRPAMIPRPVFG